MITKPKTRSKKINDRYFDYPWGLFCQQCSHLYCNATVGDNEIFHPKP